MASTGLNFSNITPDNGAIKELSQLIFEQVTGADKLGAIFNIIPKQKHGDKVGMIGEFGMIGKAGQGCDPNFGNSIIATKEKTWDIKEWEVAESICYKDLEGTLAKLALKTKTSIADLTGTEYLAEIILPRLELAIMKMMLRLAWFGDKDADTVTSGGVLKDGTDKAFFTVTDGIWKHLFSIVAQHSERRTEISANTTKNTASVPAITFESQKNAFKASGYATGILDQLIEDASQALRQAENQVIYITQCFKDALDADIKKNNKGSELQWESLFAGIQKSQYNGIKLVVIPFWDEIIKGYEGTATYWNKPYRALYCVGDVLMVGLESESEISEVDVWFEKKDQKNYILAKDKLGTLIGQDDLIQVAY